MRSSGLIFLSGRLVALVVLLLFQVLVVRILPAEQYGHYALVFALATLMQTAVSFGIPRIIPKYVSQAGITLPRATVRHLALRLLLIRLLCSAVLMAATLWGGIASGLIGMVDRGLLVVGGLFILAGLIQIDADAMAQSLGLQRVSRNCTVGEAVVRLALVGILARSGHIATASDVLTVSLATAACAAFMLVRAVFLALRGPDEPDARLSPIDWRELRAIGLSGYASSMAWFASSPAVIRMIASRILSVASFAGLSFAQTLVMSFQRYTPGMLLFPFIEPNVMKHYARTGDRSRLEAALSLVTKIDMIVIGGAVVGTIVAGRELVELATGGKYGAFAYALPWLLVYVATSSVYKSFEIVAVALGGTSALLRTLSLSLVWLALAVVLAEYYGLLALLVCPVGDALSRLFFMHRALVRFGVERVVDMTAVFSVLTLVAACAVGGRAVAVETGATAPLVVAIGVVSALLYGAAVVALRLLRHAEIDIVIGKREGFAPALARRYARP